MIKAYQALWTRLTASGTVKPKTHILDNEASAEGNPKELHDPISPPGQPPTKSSGKSHPDV